MVFWFWFWAYNFKEPYGVVQFPQTSLALLNIDNSIKEMTRGHSRFGLGKRKDKGIL